MVRVERLLADCLDDARTQPLGTVPVAVRGAGYAAARRTFLAAGLDALRAHTPDAGWVQLSLACAPAGPGPLPYGQLATTARELLDSGQAREFFFMHKPPGLRLRFLAARPSRAGELRETLLRRLGPGQAEGTWGPPVAGVYEPETYLFGGPPAMPWVHALFTADSRAWLDVHTLAAGAPPPPSWRVSLALLHAVFDALDIVGWEHRGVWQAVREEAGRRLPGGLEAPDLRRAAAGIRDWWELSPGARLEALPQNWRNVVGEHVQAVGRAAEQWRTRYFASGEATIGARRAAAHYAVFHWNRAALSTARQCLLTEALAADGREGVR
ncbi:thiopeptide-type bacteriocin biosynthesis protein [Streptomyces sp. Go40/10]|uniref:thiopeptide-type bacteriocin biosynthesis protein n=1 Tax=Streptomyces sp. Go40/10 TaxID=2825844 RepID=UPI001E46AF6B|nr:thiopeptide-type bacteriocin biosynthesis protein [Streptomyces sp. Go40/10]UFR00297.1 thiopeptide-type bacteriocin biosynthesis protein [Streptomyces sp. Go40/10]